MMPKFITLLSSMNTIVEIEDVALTSQANVKLKLAMVIPLISLSIDCSWDMRGRCGKQRGRVGWV